MNRSSTALLAGVLAAGGLIGSGLTNALTDDRDPTMVLIDRPAIRGAAAALCPEGRSLTAAQRIGHGAANAFAQFDDELYDDDRATCGDPVDATALGALIAVVQGEMIDHDDAIETMAFALETSLVLADRLGLDVSVDPEVAALMTAGRFDDAAELQRSIDDRGGQDLFKLVTNDALATVQDDTSHDEYQQVWAGVHDAADND